MRKKVENVLRTHGLFSPNRAILTACSGGIDSLVLLDVLICLRRAGGPRIVCAHVEHGIRGAESRADARFVEEYCAARRIPFTCAAVDVPAYARKQRCSTETAARLCRYEFLHRARGTHGCDCIATAHHADDLAETVLMRILRGTGPSGLRAMSERDGVLLRPLLAATRADIVSYAAERGLTPRHDESNELLDATRNRIRHVLLPALRADYNPSIGAALTRLSALAQEEDDFLSGLAADALAQADSAEGLSQAALQTLHPALQRRVLRLYWRRETGTLQDLSYLHEESMRALITAKGAARRDMPRGYTARCRYGYLVLRTEQRKTDIREDTEILLPIEREYAIIDFQGAAIRMRHISRADMDEYMRLCGDTAIFLDAAQISPSVLRTRRAGDYMRLPIGRKKLKKILIDDHIPREQRDTMPLLARPGGSEILWMPGGRKSAAVSVTERTRDIVMIECVKETTA